MCSSIKGLCSGGKTEAYIRISITTPRYDVNLTPIPKISDIPIPSKPIIKIQSIKGLPAKPLKNSSKGPFVAKLRKPVVGDDPSIQPFPDSVAYPKPNNLSRNGHKKIQPVKILNKPKK